MQKAAVERELIATCEIYGVPHLWFASGNGDAHGNRQDTLWCSCLVCPPFGTWDTGGQGPGCPNVPLNDLTQRRTAEGPPPHLSQDGSGSVATARTIVIVLTVTTTLLAAHFATDFLPVGIALPLASRTQIDTGAVGTDLDALGRCRCDAEEADRKERPG